MSKLSEDVIKCNEKIPMHRNSRSGLPFALAKMLLIILKVCPKSLVFHTKVLLICIFVIMLSSIVKLISSGSLNKIINTKRLVLNFFFVEPKLIGLYLNLGSVTLPRVFQSFRHLVLINSLVIFLVQ